MDNAPCHPVDIILSNVRLQYFPPSTTSVLQPPDQGIIRAFKAHYRKYNDTISSISDYSTASSPSPSSDYSTVSSVDDEQSEALKILDDLLQHITIGGERMNASDFVDMDEDMPAFNLWYDDCEHNLTTDLIELDDDDELPDETDFPITETPPKYRKPWK